MLFRHGLALPIYKQARKKIILTVLSNSKHKAIISAVYFFHHMEVKG